MIMVCQGRNIPLSFSSVELLFSTKSICVAIILCLSTLPSRAEAGEYFNPNLLKSPRVLRLRLIYPIFRKMAYRRAPITWMFTSTISTSVQTR